MCAGVAVDCGKALVNGSPKLKRIDLSYNALGADGGQAIVAALSTSRVSDVTLGLSSCDLDYPTREELKKLATAHAMLEITGLG